MLQDSHVATRLPAQDLERAKAFYAEKLGLIPAEERPGGVRYVCGDSDFVLFETTGAPSGTHTQMAFDVTDLEATMADLRARGLVFEEYDVTVDGVVHVEGNYPSKGGVGEKGAWFRDSEGNLLGIGQSIT
jgi:catechol 2,3-dioxygenase-like lactoylglutathione lyase family enzyme